MGDQRERKVKVMGHWPSPFIHRVRIALKLKEIEYEYIEEVGLLTNKSPELLKYNPVHKKIPVLVVDEKPIAESQVIIEFLDEAWDSGSPLLPKDPYARAQARFWARFIDEKFFAAFMRAVWGPEEGREQAIKESSECLKILDKEIEGKRFFGGERIGFVDIVANFIAYWIGPLEDAMERQFVPRGAFPSLLRWKEEFLGCEVVKETLPPRAELVDFLVSRREDARAGEFKYKA